MTITNEAQQQTASRPCCESVLITWALLTLTTAYWLRCRLLTHIPTK
nr:MAG TPA: hypothetical protein [Caudoviricetes sp.]